MDPSQDNPAPASVSPPPDARQQIVDRLKDAVNVLVTVSNNPSVDQLSAAIGLTLLLNKLGKHATAVFSGESPSTLEFLQPEKTLEKNTNSLRDFIIALDKSKADKLRYKVEETVVKIFITPYRTSLSEDDLEFSQGDFNVDVVIALGVQTQEELDQAITAEPRILHDATIISVSNKTPSNLGTINWHDEIASSLCEMLVFLGEALKSEFLDAQMATAFLTGIVAETDRFSNDKTTPRTMTISGRLMTAGANQQLIATKLEETETENIPPENLDELAEEAPESEKEEGDDEPPPSSDGTLQIAHEDSGDGSDADDTATEPPAEGESAIDPIHIDEHGTLLHANEIEEATKPDEPPAMEPSKLETSKLILEPPSLGGAMTAIDGNLEGGMADDSSDPLSLPPVDTGDKQFLSHAGPPAMEPPPPYVAPPPAASEPHTLSDIEEEVHSPHLERVEEEDIPTEPSTSAPDTEQLPDLQNVRDAVADAHDSSVDEPLKAEGASSVNLDLGHGDNADTPLEYEETAVPVETPPQQPLDPVQATAFGLPPNLVAPTSDPASALQDDPLALTDDSSASADETQPLSTGTPPPPPPVPPPMPLPPLSPGADPSDPLASSSNPFTLPPAQ